LLLKIVAFKRTIRKFLNTVAVHIEGIGHPPIPYLTHFFRVNVPLILNAEVTDLDMLLKIAGFNRVQRMRKRGRGGPRPFVEGWARKGVATKGLRHPPSFPHPSFKVFSRVAIRGERGGMCQLFGHEYLYVQGSCYSTLSCFSASALVRPCIARV
jgi:hypothetical protein